MSSTSFCKRVLDLVLCLPIFILALIPSLFIIIIIRLTSQGPAIHWSKRVGTNNDIFLMPKFRSMHNHAPQIATDLLATAANKYVTPFGKILRKTSLDELPQLWSVIIGDMSLVGPRPALYNQYHLIDIRTKKMVHTLKPGITGWAQINGRDNLSDEEKAIMDEHYLKNLSIMYDLKIIFLTIFHVMKLTNISH
jgi:O-antigen biosynthesis protein WbqP